MSCVNNSSDINQTFIIESQSATLSACTGIYTNAVISCTGDTQMILDTGVILFEGSLYTNQDITANTINANYYFSGGTELETIINYKAISGGTFDSTLGNLSLITYDNTEILVTGFTNYYTTGATLIDSTVYFDRNDVLSAYTLDLSSLDINDTFVTGGTPDNVTRSYIFTNNSGGTFTVAALTDIVTTGGTFYSSTHEIIFTNNTGGTFTVTGITDYFTTGATLIDSTVYFDRNDALSAYTLDLSSLDINDTFITGVTFNNNNLVLTNNSGGTISTLIDNFSGLTVNGNLNVTGETILNTISANTFSVNYLSATTISATTYLNLPIDVRVTGGTYSDGTTIFTNNTGGTFNVTGYDSTDTYVTGYTYLNNTFTIKQNLGELDLSVTVNDFSGLTINGNLNVTGNTTSNIISATTYLNLPIDIRVTGGTFEDSTNTITFTNNTGGTFNVTGITDVFVTGGTPNDLTRTYLFTNNTGGTFTVSGITDVYVSGATYSGGTVVFTNSTGGTFSVTGLTTNLPHNQLTGLQGGIANEYYHLTNSQLGRVLDLIYINSVNSLTNLTALSERGVATPVSIRYNMLTNDDVFTAATINNGIGSVLSGINTGNVTIAVGSLLTDTTYTLSMSYLRKGIATGETKSATYSTAVPKWSNVSVVDIINTYALASANLGTKIISTATAMNNTGSASNQYMWFVTTNSAGAIFDGNNFSQSISALNVEDGVSEFYKKSFPMTLQDSTVVTMYSYRTRTLKTFAGNVYRIT